MLRQFAAVFVACLLISVAWQPLPARAQQDPPGSEQQSKEFSDLYQRFVQTQDNEEQIALGEKALALEPKLASWSLSIPRETVRAQLLFVVGGAYLARSVGIRADNLENAIARLEGVLAFWTRDNNAPDWATTHNNLGIAYWGRIRGERADNQEKAIAHFETALPVLTREAFPQQWAQIQNNLAIVYWNRVHGDRADNLERSIGFFLSALTVFTRESTPVPWGQAQNNLGNVYGVRIRGDRGDNQEEAIGHFQAALTVLSRETTPFEWGTAQSNIAVAYMIRARGVRADNQEQAIAHLEEALKVFTREGYPMQWANVQNLVGNVYVDRSRGEHADNQAKAIAAYDAALSVFTRDAYPRDHMRAARSLAHAHAAAGDWAKAGAAYASAREAFLLLFGQGLEETEARSLISEAGTLFAEAAFAAARRGELETALEVAGEGRARLMAVALRLQSLELSDERRQRLNELRATIRKSEHTAETVQGPERAAAIEKLVALRQELLDLVKSGGYGNSQPGAGLAEARRIAAAGGAVVMPIVTDFGTEMIVVAKSGSGKELAAISLPDLTTQRLAVVLIGPAGGPPAGWLGAYFINYLEGDEYNKRWPEWLAAIDKLGPELWSLFGERLDAALKQHGLKPGARLVWLPSGWLGTMPVTLAQDPASKRRLADDYEIVFAPSLEVLAVAQKEIDIPAAPTLAAIVNPTGDLAGTDKEGAVVASYFASDARTVLEGSAAGPAAVLKALKGKSHWHFASHGTFSWNDARQSGLVMSGRALLTIDRLLETDGLGHPRLVVLSACETGLYDIKGSPDEFVGLPATFMALGAAGVLGTLWPVSDAATALLIAKFYELHMKGGKSPPTALAEAQAWLRQATNDELEAYAVDAATHGRIASRHLDELKYDLSAEGLRRSRNRSIVEWINKDTQETIGRSRSTAPVRQAARPYAHPFFWAGFIYTGL